ncbi:MAG: DUF1501 domain-containing protein [Planctomycetaceae bacterium]
MLRLVAERRLSNGTLTRSEFLRLGGISAVATLGAAQRTFGSESSVLSVPRAKSVIIVFASGGQSQFETWDPKPDAPAEVRGEFGSIATAIPGTFVCEHLPQLATLADRYALVKSMSHLDVDHGSAVYLTLTGQYHQRISSNPPPRPTDLPSVLSVFKRVRPDAGTVAPAIEINGPAIVAPQEIAAGQFGGLLGREFDPLIVGNVNEETIAVPGLGLQPDVATVRIQERQRLLSAVDDFVRAGAAGPGSVSGQYRKAFELLDDPRTREAFDLSAEPGHVRERYGRNRSGQACLLARRLAQAGVPLITVVLNHHSRGQDLHPEDADAYGWDTHNDIFYAMRRHLLPRFDQTLSALLEDLAARDMLDDTLVVCMGEFGRAPTVALERSFAGTSPGRKHWAAVYSIMLAGAGVAGGKVIGRTDRHGAYPTGESFGPWDVAATVFAALGVDPAGHYVDALQRPFVISPGRPMTALYGG